MLERIEPQSREGGGVFMPGDAENAAFLMEAVAYRIEVAVIHQATI